MKRGKGFFWGEKKTQIYPTQVGSGGRDGKTMPEIGTKESGRGEPGPEKRPET